MRTLQLTLHAKDIKLAVKADTYITGQIDKSSDMVKNAALAYNEQAGDENYHEVKLYRTMRGAVSKFEAAMAEYVESSSSSSVADTLTSATADEFTITFTVGARYNGAYSNTIASLAQEFIINMMLYAWWQSIKPALAKDYLEFSMENLSYIRRCLSKTAPDTNTSSYSDVTGSTSPITSGDDPAGGEQEESKGTLIQTASCDYDTVNDGVGQLPHMYGQKAFKLDCYDASIDDSTYTLEYSGSDTVFYYTVGTSDNEGGYNYSLAEQVATLAQLALLLKQSDETNVLLVWLDNKNAGVNTIKVYRK